MRILTVSEFRSWVREHNPEYYVFSSENNSHLPMLGLRISLRFQNLTVSASLDRLCFRNNRDCFSLEHVKEVHMYDDRVGIGTVFDVVCDMNHRRCIWRLIAD